MKLSKLIERYIVSKKNFRDIEIKRVEYDSRKIEKDSLFVAIKGFETDGHKYISSAIESGAVAVCHCDELPNYRDDIIYIKVDDTRNLLAFISDKFYDSASKKLKLIGISGTNGKTSFCNIIDTIFENCGFKTDYIGTLGTKTPKNDGEEIRTTPESSELNEYIARMVKSNISHCFMEVSSHGLDLERVDYLDFDIGVFSNLTPDHLDFHSSMEEYYQAKKKLYYKTSSYNIINIDDEYGKRLMRELRSDNRDVISFGQNEISDFKIENINLQLDSTSFTVRDNINDVSYDFIIGMIGKIAIYNTLPAIIIALKEGLSLEEIKKAVAKINGAKGRVEKIAENVFIDYAHTPDAMEKVFEIVKEVSDKSVVTVFGCGGDRDTLKRSVMGNIASKNSEKTIITSDNPRSEDIDKINEDILEGIDKTKDYEIENDRYEAIKKALDYRDECTILILGKGHETYQEISGERLPFSDEETILEIINNNFEVK